MQASGDGFSFSCRICRSRSIAVSGSSASRLSMPASEVAVVCPKAPGDPTLCPTHGGRSLSSTDPMRRAGRGSPSSLSTSTRSSPPLLLSLKASLPGSLRRRSELQSSRPLLAHRAPVSDAPRVVFCLRPPRSLSGAVPIAVPEREPTRLPGSAADGAVHRQDGGPCDFDQRLLSTDRPRSGTASPRHASPSCAPVRTCQASSDSARTEPASRQAPPGRIYGCYGATGWRRPRLGVGRSSSCTDSAVATSASPSSDPATASRIWSLCEPSSRSFRLRHIHRTNPRCRGGRDPVDRRRWHLTRSEEPVERSSPR